MNFVAVFLNYPLFVGKEIKKVRNVFKFKSILIYSINKAIKLSILNLELEMTSFIISD